MSPQGIRRTQTIAHRRLSLRTGQSTRTWTWKTSEILWTPDKFAWLANKRKPSPKTAGKQPSPDKDADKPDERCKEAIPNDKVTLDKWNKSTTPDNQHTKFVLHPKQSWDAADHTKLAAVLKVTSLANNDLPISEIMDFVRNDWSLQYFSNLKRNKAPALTWAPTIPSIT